MFREKNCEFITHLDMRLLESVIQKCNDIVWIEGQYDRSELVLKNGRTIKVFQNDIVIHQETHEAIEPIIGFLAKYFPGRSVIRVEIATLLPGSKLNWHSDKPEVNHDFHNYSHRLHVPLTTNENCFQLYRNEAPQHLEVGSVYELNNINVHSASNFGERERSHLIVDMVDTVQRLPLRYDVQRLWTECVDIIGKYGWGDGQICLTHRFETTDPVERMFDGAGSLKEREFKEADFCVFNREFDGSYLEEVLNSIPYLMGRFRLLRVKSRSCYSVHADQTMRLHMPLITNPHAYFIFPGKNIIAHLPANGHMFLTNTRLRHTAVNAGSEDRIHLVGALAK
jgi:hypothetical protein